jgi:hypothetical protein
MGNSWYGRVWLIAAMCCQMDSAELYNEPHAGAASTSASLPAWDPLIQLDATPSARQRGPIFDSLGNAWVVIDNGVNLVAHQSNGSSGTWKPPHIIGPARPDGAARVGVAVDRSGGFYVTWGTGQAGSGAYPLMWTKYSPATGWRTPQVIHTSASDFTETFPSVDSAGRLVVVFNPDGVASIASNPAQTGWGALQTIAPPPRSARVVLPSVAANKSGTRLALVYLVYPRGLRYAFFDSALGRWGEAQLIPGSEDATFSSYSAWNAFPIAVDESGNVTLVCAIQRVFYTLAGFRYESGVWTATQLLPWSRSGANPDNFGGVAISSAEAVLVVVPTAYTAGVASVSVFRFTPGQGWRTEIAATYAGGTSRCKIAWFDGSGAVAIYEDFSNLSVPLTAALYQNGAWGSAPPIPGGFTSGFAALATAPTGEVVLAIPVSGGGVYVTWLRP